MRHSLREKINLQFVFSFLFSIQIDFFFIELTFFYFCSGFFLILKIQNGSLLLTSAKLEIISGIQMKPDDDLIPKIYSTIPKTFE